MFDRLEDLAILVLGVATLVVALFILGAQP